MKRMILLSLAVVLVVSAVGFAQPQTWTGYLSPGDYVTTNISNVNDVQCHSRMTCYVPVAAPILHATWVTYGTSLQYIHLANLSYGQSSTSSGSLNYSTGVLHWSLGTAAVDAYSIFQFVW